MLLANLRFSYNFSAKSKVGCCWGKVLSKIAKEYIDHAEFEKRLRSEARLKTKSKRRYKRIKTAEIIDEDELFYNKAL